MTLRRGQFVRLTYNGKTIKAMVMLASPNGKSLFFGFDGALWSQGGGVFPGQMPVLQHEDGTYRDLVCAEPVTFEAEQ